MEALKEKLKSFQFSWDDETKLTKEFARLAPYFISGGYIKVREDYRIYPTTVEFYFHSENENGVHDPIVYHRNNKYVHGNLPYFPMFTLHAHDSGYDITFENAKEGYRASVLIRAYQVWDVKHSCWLKWDTTEQQFRAYLLKDKTPINTQVWYLKYLLNGFTMGSGSLIDWIDATELIELSEKDGKPRHNVPKYEYKPEKKKFDKLIKGHNKDNKPLYEPCNRAWSFSRKESIIDII